jgi:hypothetical protein
LYGCICIQIYGTSLKFEGEIRKEKKRKKEKETCTWAKSPALGPNFACLSPFSDSIPHSPNSHFPPISPCLARAARFANFLPRSPSLKPGHFLAGPTWRDRHQPRDMTIIALRAPPTCRDLRSPNRPREFWARTPIPPVMLLGVQKWSRSSPNNRAQKQ